MGGRGSRGERGENSLRRRSRAFGRTKKISVLALKCPGGRLRGGGAVDRNAPYSVAAGRGNRAAPAARPGIKIIKKNSQPPGFADRRIDSVEIRKQNTATSHTTAATQTIRHATPAMHPATTIPTRHRAHLGTTLHLAEPGPRPGRGWLNGTGGSPGPVPPRPRPGESLRGPDRELSVGDATSDHTRGIP